MIIKGRSPSMRHVSRTHRVALDWLFDRINFDPKIQIKYIDTKNQLADILTKGSFTRDEWNHLLHLFNIMFFSTISRSHFFVPNGKQSLVMSKSSQEGLSNDSPTVKAKPRSSAMNLVSHQSLSVVKQNSHNTNDSEIPGSGGTDMRLHSYGKPKRESTESLSLHSQERTQGVTSKIGYKHCDENVSSHSIGKPMRGTWNQDSSKSSRQEYECSHSIGNQCEEHTHTRKENQTRIS